MGLITLMSCMPAKCPEKKKPETPVGSAPEKQPAESSPEVRSGLVSDEGMWTFDNFPSEALKERHGFGPDQEWLDKVRMSSVRLAQGCSGSIVSGQGLVLTNHHCVHRCIQELSTPTEDLVKDGFYAKESGDERRCPGLEVNRLVKITDVTERMQKSAEGKDAVAGNEAKKAEQSRIEKECATAEEVRCDVVSLYQGGQYHLYEYERHKDVRLVFAPEVGIGFFGGDPDNFMFPRWTLDMAFLRIYRDDKPIEITPHFKWSENGVAEGDLTFVSGHPGRTNRQITMAMLEFERDVILPKRLMSLHELRGMLDEFATRGPEQKRISAHLLFAVENGIKAYRGMFEALLNPVLMEGKQKEEEHLRTAVEKDPELVKTTGDAWKKIESTVGLQRTLYGEYLLMERHWNTSALFRHARTIVRAAGELPKADTERLPEFTEARFPALRQALLSEAPIYEDLEKSVLRFLFMRFLEELGPDHALVKSLFEGKNPGDVAMDLVNRTTLRDPKVRAALLEGGQTALAASDDPLLAFVGRMDVEARRIRKQYEDIVEAPLRAGMEAIAAARFSILGTSVYPDATFSLRLSFGIVKGWEETGKTIHPLTTLGGVFERHTGSAPFALPASWLEKKDALDLSVPFNFSTTNDIIGGNSGSPVFNRDAEIVGLIFDGNIHSLGGDYSYVPENNRAVAVHSRAMIEALRKIYGADRLLTELGK